MTPDNEISSARDKLFDDKCIHVCFCDQCCWNGYVDEKVVYEFEGLRPETEDGFIYIYEVYDYPVKGEKTKHEHKYNQRLIDELVAVSLCKEMESKP
jgi:hypothetical protein